MQEKTFKGFLEVLIRVTEGNLDKINGAAWNVEIEAYHEEFDLLQTLINSFNFSDKSPKSKVSLTVIE